ncbi:protein AKNAD1 [Pelodytes ibericus]
MEVSAAAHDLNNSCKQSDSLEDPWGNMANDATDDEQEELPYDGIQECYLIPSTELHMGSNIHEHPACINHTQDEASVQTDYEIINSIDHFDMEEIDVFSFSESVSRYTNESDSGNQDVVSYEAETKFLNTIIPDVLRRHFSDDGTLSPCQFIEYETIPEISIAESSDEILTNRETFQNWSHHDSEPEQGDDSERFSLSTEINDNQMSNIISEQHSDVDDPSFDENVGQKSPMCTEECTGQVVLPDEMDKGNQYYKNIIQRRSSFHDIKYGQGQVHYKLPDFSKIPPKVKIPKGNDHIKPIPPMKRTKSSPNLTGPSIVIQDILESMQPFVESAHPKYPGSTTEIPEDQVCKIPVHFPDFSSKHKTNTVLSPVSEHLTAKSPQLLNIQEAQTEAQSQGATFQAANSQYAEVPDVSLNAANTQGPTEGEKMSRVLAEQAQQLKVNVFQNLKSCLESLELNYLSAKEKHRDLQLQIYRTGTQTVGEFDLERQVEGQLFRLGMLLEDIQEQMNERGENHSQSMHSPVSPSDTYPTLHTEKSTEEVIPLPLAPSTNSGEVDNARLEDEDLSSVAWGRSLNRMVTADRPIYKHDPAHLEDMDYENVLPSYLWLQTHHRISKSEADLRCENQSISMSSDKPTDKKTSLIFQPPAHHVDDKTSFHLKEQIFSDDHLHKDNFDDWRLAEKTYTAKEIFSHRHEELYQLFEAEKAEKRISNHGKFPIFIQEKAVGMDFPDCK